tara:strand:+ start:288 stop:764 length:477 start_codon:yes stop_codon:yes gene_type:complete
MIASGKRIDLEELIELHQNSLLTYRQLGHKYGVSHETIRKTLRKAGIKARRRGARWKAEKKMGGPAFLDLDSALVRKGWEDGTSVKELAKKFGCSPSAIYRRLNETKKEGEGRLKTVCHKQRDQEIRDHHQYITDDCEKIGEFFGLTATRIRQIVRRG